MTVPASALPKHVRDRLPKPPPKRRRKVADAAPVSERRCRWRCVRCGETFDWWTGQRGAQTHANGSGHARVEIVWGEGEAE